MLHWLPYPVAIIGTVVTIITAVLLHYVGEKIINARKEEPKERYRHRKFLNTIIAVLSAAAIIIVWAHPMQRTGTFLGLVGAGVAIALREPLLSIAGRMAIFAGNMYTVGDRIQVETMSGDVIDVGFFYTRMMEIGNWVGGDQPSGRIVQLPNSKMFGNAIFNYTQNFAYIWDEIHLPITYQSNMEAASKILTDVGATYTREFLESATEDLERMQHSFVVPSVELKPAVFVKVTSNWLELTLRYIVDPKKRRAASSFIYGEVFKRLQQRKDIAIASETMDLAIHPPEKAA